MNSLQSTLIIMAVNIALVQKHRFKSKGRVFTSKNIIMKILR
jgi:hypothetical protein